MKCKPGFCIFHDFGKFKISKFYGFQARDFHTFGNFGNSTFEILRILEKNKHATTVFDFLEISGFSQQLFFNFLATEICDFSEIIYSWNFVTEKNTEICDFLKIWLCYISEFRDRNLHLFGTFWFFLIEIAAAMYISGFSQLKFTFF